MIDALFSTRFQQTWKILFMFFCQFLQFFKLCLNLVEYQGINHTDSNFSSNFPYFVTAVTWNKLGSKVPLCTGTSSKYYPLYRQIPIDWHRFVSKIHNKSKQMQHQFGGQFCSYQISIRKRDWPMKFLEKKRFNDFLTLF